MPSATALTRSSSTVAIALLAASAATADPSLPAKQAEAQRVIAQIEQMDGRLEHAIEAYDGANVRLAGIGRALRQNGRDLILAHTNLRRAQAALSARLVALYTSDADSSTLGVLLGATSLDDLMNRLDAATRVSDQDAQIVREVIAFRNAVRRQEAELRRARAN